MNRKVLSVIAVLLLVLSVALAQESTDPFPEPIATTDRVISVKFAEFATLPISSFPGGTDARPGGTS